jgi:hypothetical protein
MIMGEMMEKTLKISLSEYEEMKFRIKKLEEVNNKLMSPLQKVEFKRYTSYRSSGYVTTTVVTPAVIFYEVSQELKLANILNSNLIKELSAFDKPKKWWQF